MQEFVYNGRTIHIQDAEMLCLTDMWRAADCPRTSGKGLNAKDMQSAALSLQPKFEVKRDGMQKPHKPLYRLQAVSLGPCPQSR